MAGELRVGVVGVGAIGKTHIERINTRLKGAKVVACSDVNVDFGKQVAENYGCKFFEDGEAMIASEEVDAVIVATVSEFHEKYCQSAIKAGKYVLVEKPLALKPEDCKRIVDAEIAGGKMLVQVGFMRRYDRDYRKLKEAIRSGKFGEPLMVHCAHRNAKGDPWYTTEMAVEGSLIHEIDILRWLLDDEYDTVEVVYPKRTGKAPEGVMDPQIMYLTTKTGIRIDVEAFIWTGHCYDIKCEVCCEDGILNLPDPPALEVLAHAHRGHDIHSDWSTRFTEAYDIEIQAWIDATVEGRVDGPNAWDGYVDQAVAGAAGIARDTQSKVKIEVEEKPDFYRLP